MNTKVICIGCRQAFDQDHRVNCHQLAVMGSRLVAKRLLQWEA